MCLEDFTLSKVFIPDEGLTSGSMPRMVPQEDPCKKDFSDQSSLRTLHTWALCVIHHRLSQSTAKDQESPGKEI